jgi:cytochrome c553
MVRAWLGASALAVVVLAATAGSALTERRSPNYNFALHCLGCHTFEGVSAERGRIPALKDVVGHFTRIVEGRRYLVNVPGIVNSGLSAEDTAAILNWMIDIYGGASRPSDFRRFDAGEVARLRAQRPDDVMKLRGDVRSLLSKRGFEIGAYP